MYLIICTQIKKTFTIKRLEWNVKGRVQDSSLIFVINKLLIVDCNHTFIKVKVQL